MDGNPTNNASKCPMMGGREVTAVVQKMSNKLWWPNTLDLNILKHNSPETDPMGEDFDYAAQPRQGPPPALADQAEIWPQAVLGRPDDPDGQCGARIHGL